MMKHVHAGSAVLLASLLLSANAQATTFVVSLRNTSTENWAQGLLSTTQLIHTGPNYNTTTNPYLRPAVGTNEYYTYAYVATGCDISDGFCGTAGCDDGNATVLAQRWGLTLGTNAWVIPPINGVRQLSSTSYAGCASAADCGGGAGVYCLAGRPGGLGATITWTGGVCSYDVTFAAVPSQRMSYVAKIVGRTYDFVSATTSFRYDQPTVALYSESGANAGYPLPAVENTYFGFNINSLSQSNGNSGSCAAACPTNPETCYVTRRTRVGDGTLPDAVPRGTLSQLWRYTAPAPYTTEGLAIGAVITSGMQGVVTTNGGNYQTEPFTVGTGRSVVFNLASGTEIADGSGATGLVPPDGRDLMGFPMIENLTGGPSTCSGGSGGTSCEYTVGEIGDVAQVFGGATGAGVFGRAFDLTQGRWATAWTSRPYGFPGYWNMGQSAGDVRSDQSSPGNSNEIVVADLYANVSVLRAADGTALNSISLYNTYAHERLFGHAAIADVDGVAGNEIIVFGANSGRVLVLKAAAPNGTALTVAWASDALPSGARAFANGPAVGDIDGDGHNEIIVMSGFLNQVFAFDPRSGSTAPKYTWPTLSGHGYYYTSPVIGDVTGTSAPEVMVFSNDSVLSVLAAPASGSTGTVVWEYVVGNGESAWFTPALGNMVGSSKLDVVAASYHTIEVVDVDARRPEYRYSSGTANFYPSAAIQAGSATTPGAFIYTSGWTDRAVYRFGTPYAAPVPTPWLTFMGNNQRTGAR